MNYQDYIDGTKKLIDESQKETGPYKIQVSGKEFVVLPNVFSPKYFGDSEFFFDVLPVRKDDFFLEIGPGTGLLSIAAAYKGAGKVVAVDINPDAVKNTQENIKLHNMEDKVEVRQGDVYGPIREDEKFDIIFWNLPFGLLPEDAQINVLEKAAFDPGYKVTSRYVLEAKEHLKPGGRLLAGFSTTLGKMDILKEIAEKGGYRIEVLGSVDSKEVYPVKFELLELVPKNKVN